MSYSMMVLAVVAVLFIVASVVLVHKLLSMRQEFAQVRLLSLSTAADSDVVGGVGISLLVASPASLSAMVNLLDSRYPLSEVVVALNCEKQPNLLQQLKLRYALVACSVEGCTVYRSRDRAYRRLVVVTTREKVDSAALYDLAAHNALFDYLLRVPADYQLFTFAVGRIAEVLASELSGGVDVVTTEQIGLYLLSRREWLSRGGFGDEPQQSNSKIVHISEPLCLNNSDKDYSLLVERSRYNFCDFLALKIMRYGNKLLSLIKT